MIIPEGYGSTTHKDLIECTTCYSVVKLRSHDSHSRWHAQLDAQLRGLTRRIQDVEEREDVGLLA